MILYYIILYLSFFLFTLDEDRCFFSKVLWFFVVLKTFQSFIKCSFSWSGFDLDFAFVFRFCRLAYLVLWTCWAAPGRLLVLQNFFRFEWLHGDRYFGLCPIFFQFELVYTLPFVCLPSGYFGLRYLWDLISHLGTGERPVCRWADGSCFSCSFCNYYYFWDSGLNRGSRLGRAVLFLFLFASQ